MKTVHELSAIRWHLETNIFPKLNNSAINGIIDTLERFNKGEIGLTHQIRQNTSVTVGEMCDALKIELK